MDVIVKESKNDLDLIIKFIDFEVLCVLIKVLAKLKNSIHEMVLLGYSITTKEDEITISNKKSGKLLTVKLENSENTSDKKTYKVEIRHRIKEVVKKDSKTVSMKYSYIIMSGDIRNHDSIEEINEDDLKGLARKVATTNSNGIYRIINYLSDDRIEDYEFANIIQMLKTDAIKSQLFDSNDLRDIIDQLNGEYKKVLLIMNLENKKKVLNL